MEVSKQTLKEYDFKTIFDYYNYIVDSLINGQRKQAIDLIKKLSKEQKKDAINYFDIVGESQHDNQAKILTLELL